MSDLALGFILGVVVSSAVQLVALLLIHRIENSRTVAGHTGGKVR